MNLRSICVAVLLSFTMITVAAVAQSTPAPTAKAAPAKTATSDVQKPPQPGMVWANTKSKIYHKEGDQWYGKGKNGKWLTEADAKKQGYNLAKANAVTAKANK